MTSRLVVTGVDGFVGRHVARIAAQAGFGVFGISRSQAVDDALDPHLVGYASADLRYAWPRDAPIDAPVIHLAGLAAVGPSFDRPQDYITDNSAMVTNLCEARLEQGSSARIVGISTGAVYAHSNEDAALSEGDPVGFTSPYVVSKVLVENQLAYYRARGLDTVVARPFNHVGPGQGPGFLVPDLLGQLRGLAAGDPLHVGNLSTARDYTDVRDVAHAYLALATADAVAQHVYNVASGTPRTGSDVLAQLCLALGITEPPIQVDSTRIRATDPARIAGDSSRLRRELGWSARIPFAQTIADTVHG